MSTEPITGLTYQEAGSRQTDALQNAELNFYGAWLNCVVLSVGDTTPPATPANGDCYIVGASATGAWATHDNSLAVYRSGWQFYAPKDGVTVRNKDYSKDYIYDGSGPSWSVKDGGGGSGDGKLTVVTEAAAFTADPATHAGVDVLVLAGGDITFDNAEPYEAGHAFNICATAGIELVEDGVTLTPPAGGTLELDADMSVTVVMTGATAGRVIGQTVPA